VRIFKTKPFARLARREGISDETLQKAVSDAERGLIEADLGAGVIKQRVARRGEGKSGGFRTLLAFRSEKRSVFLFVFAKKDRANIGDDELETLRETAAYWLKASDAAIETSIKAGEIQEVGDEEDSEEDEEEQA
jgi:hypothetical protein